MHLVLIPGLGVDERLFQFLDLPPELPRTIIRWISPEKDETLAAYAGRLTGQVPATGPYILLGVSFGGMIAVEMAKLLQPDLTIILSSMKSRDELPWYYRLAGRLRLPTLLPLGWGRKLPLLQDFIFGPETPAEARLLRQIIRETDMNFARWALQAIATWPNREVPPGLVHLHGTHDKLLQLRHMRNAIPVPGGEHLMILSQAPWLSHQINQYIYKVFTPLP